MLKGTDKISDFPNEFNKLERQVKELKNKTSIEWISESLVGVSREFGPLGVLAYVGGFILLASLLLSDPLLSA